MSLDKDIKHFHSFYEDKVQKNKELKEQTNIELLELFMDL